METTNSPIETTYPITALVTYGRVSLRLLYAKFVEWAKAAGIIRPLTRPQLKQDLEHAGYVVKKSNSDVVVRGLVLKG